MTLRGRRVHVGAAGVPFGRRARVPSWGGKGRNGSGGRNKCHASSNRRLTSSNKKLLGTSATLVVTGALLVVTRSY